MRKDVPTGRSCYVSALREELIARNNSYACPKPFAARNQLWRIAGCGLQQSECGRHHGNFIAASYRAILRRPRVAKAITESAQPGPALAAREGWLVARTRFFVEFRCAADEHLLLPRRDTAKWRFAESWASNPEASPNLDSCPAFRYSAKHPNGPKLI